MARHLCERGGAAYRVSEKIKKTTAKAQERLTSIEATQLGNIYLMRLTNVCERPIVDSWGQP